MTTNQFLFCYAGKGVYMKVKDTTGFLITDVHTGKAQVSFYTADLQTRYRILIEGVSRDNRPLRGEYFIEVGN